MTADEIRRATIRLSHEIVEKQAGTDGLLLIGIQRRGVPLARRIADAIPSNEGAEVPVGALDITFYRDDLSLVAQQPVVKGTELPFGHRRRDGRPRRRRAVHGPHDPGRDGRARRLRAAAGDPPGRARRPRPSRAADPGRPRRQERADVARGDRPRPPRGDRRRGRRRDRARRRRPWRPSPSRDRRDRRSRRRRPRSSSRPSTSPPERSRSAGAIATCSTSTGCRRPTSTSSCARPTRCARSWRGRSPRSRPCAAGT